MEEKIKVLSLFSSGGVAEAHLEDLRIEKKVLAIFVPFSQENIFRIKN